MVQALWPWGTAQGLSQGETVRCVFAVAVWLQCGRGLAGQRWLGVCGQNLPSFSEGQTLAELV